MNRILNLHDGGRAPLASGAEFKKAQDVLTKCLLRGGYTSVEVTRAHSEAGQLLRLAQRREASSARMREEAAGLNADATGRTSSGGGYAAATGGEDPEKGLSKADKDKAKLEELAANVRLQLHDDTVAISVQPVDGDILLTHESLTRTPARLPTYDDLALKTAAEYQSSGTVRYKAGKVFKHKRGVSSAAELALFGRYCEVLRHAGATEAPTSFATTDADMRSGVNNDEGRPVVMICNYLQSSRRQDELTRLVQTQKMSDDETHRYLYTVREEWSSAFNLHAQTVPAALATVLGRRLDMAVRAHAPGSPRKRYAVACIPHDRAPVCPHARERYSRPAHVAGPVATTQTTRRRARRRLQIRRKSRNCSRSTSARKVIRNVSPISAPLVRTFVSTGRRNSAVAARAAGTRPRTARLATSFSLARKPASPRSTRSSFR